MQKEEDAGRDDLKKMKREEATPKVVLPEDENYRLGYGVARKDVKAPWYLSRRSDEAEIESGGSSASLGSKKQEGCKKSGKKTLEEMREERLKRERREKERERALVVEKVTRDGSRERFHGSKGFSR